MFKTDARRMAVIAEAREWVGTPYHHQAAVKGVGCDCGGLIRAVGANTALMHFERQEWKRFAAYGRTPNPRQMERVLHHYLVRIPPSRARLGDVMWIEWRENLPMHLAILSEHDGRPTMIHAFADAGAVVEHGFTPEWRARVVSWWRFPGIAEPNKTVVVHG